MLPNIPHPADYDVSIANGFLPDDLPVQALSHVYYHPWESVFRNLQGLTLAGRLRGVVDGLPVLSTSYLSTEAEWRRAYMLLGFIVHSYIWGGAQPEERVPPPLAIPFLQTCQHFELPPVATYAGVALWNFKPLFDDEPIDDLSNLATLQTFTGSTDESWFYLVSVALEARGAPTIPIMLDAMAAVRENDATRVTSCLQLFAERLDALGPILSQMYDNCDPHVFYHKIRPFLAGSKNMADAGLPRGVRFDDGTPASRTSYVQYSGGSNAQSSLIQFFDLVLGIEHLPTGQTKPAPAPAEGQPPPPPSHNFIQDMRRYMPGPHRRFLEHVARVANVRPFVAARPADRALATAYDACLAVLRDFRDRHIQIVSRYIIVPARDARPSPRTNLASAPAKKNLRGTGGTALIPFLKQAREETAEPALGTWARRILSDGPGRARGGGAWASLGRVEEHANGELETVGMAGIWSVDDSEGGICHW